MVFALDSLIGNLQALLLPGGLPAIPPRTLETWVDERQALLISKHPRRLCHTTYFHRLQGPPSG